MCTDHNKKVIQEIIRVEEANKPKKEEKQKKKRGPKGKNREPVQKTDEEKMSFME